MEKDTRLSALIGRGESLFAIHDRAEAMPSTAEYAALADDWSAFFAAFPESDEEAQERFKRFLENLCAFVMGMERKGYTAAEAQSLKEHCQRTFSDHSLTQRFPLLNRMWFCAAGVFPMDCLGDERNSFGAIGNHVKYRVDACNQLMAMHCDEEAIDILANLRRMLVLMPEVKSWAERTRQLEVRAVCDYSAPLRLRHWGIYCKPENYVQMFRNWQAFFKAHPSCAKLYYEGFEAFADDAKAFVDGQEQNGIASEALSECKKMTEKGWRAMPFGARLRKWEHEVRQSLASRSSGKSEVVWQGSMDYTDGMPLHVNWEITSYCNLRCSYCFAAGKEYKNEFCTLEQAETAIRHIASANRSAYDVTLSGGEPTSHPHLAEIITLLQKHLGDRLEQIAIISNGTFSERQMEAVLGLQGQTEVRLRISIHLEYMGVDKMVTLVKRLSNHVFLHMKLMFQPDLFDKAKAMADALCELRKEYPFGLEISLLRESPQFDRWDSRYTQQHLDWVEETRGKMNRIAVGGPKCRPSILKKVQRKYRVEKQVEKRARKVIELYEGVDTIKLKKLTQYRFEGMTCCPGFSVLRIYVDGSAHGMVCGLDKYKANIYKENPFEREDWVHGIRCTKKLCGCAENYRIPKFRSAEEAERFMAEKRLEHKRLMSEYKKDEHQP